MQPLHFNNNNNSSFDIIKNITIWQHGNNRIITIGKADIMLSLTKQDPGRRLHKQNKTAKYQWSTASFDFHQMAVHKRTQMLAHCNLKQNMWLCSKQSSAVLLWQKLPHLYPNYLLQFCANSSKAFSNLNRIKLSCIVCLGKNSPKAYLTASDTSVHRPPTKNDCLDVRFQIIQNVTSWKWRTWRHESDERDVTRTTPGTDDVRKKFEMSNREKWPKFEFWPLWLLWPKCLKIRFAPILMPPKNLIIYFWNKNCFFFQLKLNFSEINTFKNT